MEVDNTIFHFGGQTGLIMSQIIPYYPYVDILPWYLVNLLLCFNYKLNVCYVDSLSKRKMMNIFESVFCWSYYWHTSAYKHTVRELFFKNFYAWKFQGSVLYNWFKKGQLERTDGSSITEGIGQGRVTENMKGAPVDDAMCILDKDAVEMVSYYLYKKTYNIILLTLN